MDSTHPTTRVLAVLELLQSHGRLSGADLADRLGVARRTVRRYIALLEEMGVPITADRGAAGRYELVAGYKLPPMMFTDGEGVALSLGLAAVRGLALTDDAASVAGAQAKLERVMPEPLKRRARAVAESISFQSARRSLAAGPALPVLSAGAHARQGVRIWYRAADGRNTARDIDPYGLVFRTGRWYVVGHCRLRDGVRTFRLDRIERAVAQERTFVRPETFDAAGYLVSSMATLPRAFAVEVWLDATLEAARQDVFEVFGILDAVDDGVWLRGQTDDLDWFARELARLPWRFRVRGPAALTRSVARHARALLRNATAAASAARSARGTRRQRSEGGTIGVTGRPSASTG